MSYTSREISRTWKGNRRATGRRPQSTTKLTTRETQEKRPENQNRIISQAAAD